ncbi:MAG: LysR substrate-binding domain-containing protein [Pseudomonadota bacterium]
MSMDDLRRMVIFYHVVDTQSFSGAARQLGIARSAVSRHISLLEKSIGVRLLNRTTRRLSLTEQGETYFQSCARIVAEAEMAMHRVRKLQDEPVGTLKVTAPSSLGNPLVTPLVSEFMQRYTTLNVELLLDDQVVDMVKEGIDVSIRVGWLDDSNFVARKLGDMPRLLCASPGYIKQQGKPESPAELAKHGSPLLPFVSYPGGANRDYRNVIANPGKSIHSDLIQLQWTVGEELTAAVLNPIHFRSLVLKDFFS